MSSGLEKLIDLIEARIQARRALAKYSMETGIPKHGDLTQADRQISELAASLEEAIERQRQWAERDQGRSR